MDGTSQRRIRFGPFEVNVAAGEIRKDGHTLRLQEQPFQILVALLDRPGEIVTREELRSRLWPSDSFGDFDQGLNTAINKLRDALGDSAANPTFVETIPKRGYRFSHAIGAEPIDSKKREDARRRQPIGARRFILALAVFLAFGAVLAVSWIRRPEADVKVPLRRFAIPARLPNISSTPCVRLVAMSPNGRHIAMIVGEGKTKLWIQDLDQPQPQSVEGSDGAMAPFWSPDSTMIGFAAAGKVKKVSVKGGPVSTLGNISDTYISGASWSPDGASIAFTAGGPTVLYTMTASSGIASLAVSPQTLEEESLAGLAESAPSGWISHPHFMRVSDDQSALLFVYNDLILARDSRSGRHQVIGPGADPFYSHTGHLLYRSGTDLWARRFSPRRMRFEEEAFLIAHNATDASVASDNTLVYRDSTSSQLVWLNRHGARLGTSGQPADGLWYPALSPDGRRIGVEALQNSSMDVWVSDVHRNVRLRLSSHPALEVLPVWSPRADEVAFSSYRAGNNDIFVRRSDAGSEERRITTAPQNERVSDWSQDGQYILYSLLDSKRGSDLWYLKRTRDEEWEPRPLLQTPFDERVAKLSPDNRYVAYLSNESGRDELYVREFPVGGRTWPVSSRGATQVRWSRSGRELFYVEAGTLISVSVRTDTDFEAGSTSRLFSHDALTGSFDPNYDVSLDGQRVLLPERVGTQEPMIRVVQNWLAQSPDR